MAPIQFDYASGVLEGANLRERMAVPAAGAKISSHFSHRGYIGYANFCAGRCRRARSPSSSLPTRLSKYPMVTATGASCSIAPIAVIFQSDRLPTVTEFSILDRIKVSTGYNVFGTASALSQNRIDALNADVARRMQ